MRKGGLFMKKRGKGHGGRGDCRNNGRGRGGRGRGRGHGKGRNHKRNRRSYQDGAKTFRRGRAIEFLESMYAKRDTLKEQLETPELQSINPTIVGELKAVEMVISEFSHTFDIQEIEESDGENELE